MEAMSSHGGMGGMASALDIQKTAAETLLKTVDQTELAKDPQDAKTNTVSGAAIPGLGESIDVTV